MTKKIDDDEEDDDVVFSVVVVFRFVRKRIIIFKKYTKHDQQFNDGKDEHH